MKNTQYWNFKLATKAITKPAIWVKPTLTVDKGFLWLMGMDSNQAELLGDAEKILSRASEWDSYPVIMDNKESNILNWKYIVKEILEKGTHKKNPYPADNIVPHDFNMKNYLDWNFDLNTEAIESTNFSGKHFIVRIQDGEAYLIYPDTKGGKSGVPTYIGNAKELIQNHPEKSTKVIARPGIDDDLWFRITNWRQIMRELIEKGMDAEGYKVKKNPYPAENILPEDFNIRNSEHWNFKLNAKLRFLDYYSDWDVKVFKGEILVKNPAKHDYEHEWVVVGDVAEALIAWPETDKITVYVPRVGDRGIEELPCVVKGLRAVIREIIEKGMKAEGYRMKKNPKVKKGDITVEIVETRRRKNPKKLWPQEGK